MAHPYTRFSLFTLAAGLLAATAFTQPGSNDPTFNPFDSGSGDGFNAEVRAVVRQADGKMIVGGFFTAFQDHPCGHIVRLNADGSYDPSFNAGTGCAGFLVEALVQQPDGKVLVGGGIISYNGVARAAILRIEADGTLDESFVPDPAFTDNPGCSAIALQPDGSILVGSSLPNGIARLFSDGSLDPSFSAAGGDLGGITTIVLQPDGKALVGGTFGAWAGLSPSGLVRLNTDGTLDTSFDTGSAFNWVIGIALQPDGKVVVAGAFTEYAGTPRSHIARLNDDGSLDTSFDPGSGLDDFSYDAAPLLLLPDGSILLGGYFHSVNGTPRNSIVRLNADGTVDTGFDPGTASDGRYVTAFDRLPDGRLWVFGAFTEFNGQPAGRFVRLLDSGAIDPGFSFGPVRGANDEVVCVVPSGNGGLFIGGSFTAYNGALRRRIARLTADGLLDLSFDPGAGCDGQVNTIAELPDGRVVIGGAFRKVNGEPRLGIARLLSDGSLDPAFDPTIGSYYEVRALALLPDGKLLVGGDFPNWTGAAHGGVVRLNTDGTVDPGFDSGMLYPDVRAMHVLSDGRILLVGYCSFAQNSPFYNVLRLLEDGGLDPSFAPGISTDGSIPSMAVLPDGRLFVGGGFTAVYGVPRHGIALLNADGGVDPSFEPGIGFDGQWDYIMVESIAVQEDGRIITGGGFTTYDGVSRPGIARLNPDGSLDPAFDPGTGVAGAYGLSTVHALALLPDDHVVIGGAFTFYNGAGRHRIARLFTSGDPCIPTQLTTTPDPVISCGAVNLKFDGTSVIAATEVPGANKYQFHFTNIVGQPAYTRNIAFPTRSFTLTKWLTNPLKAGRTYNVIVRASFDNGASWCDWGPSCTVKISWTPLAPAMVREMEETALEIPELLIYPNPTNGEQVHLTLDGFDPSLDHVIMDMYDLQGRIVMSRTLAAQDGFIDQVLDLGSGITVGLYTVRLTAGEFTATERFAIQR